MPSIDTLRLTLAQLNPVVGDVAGNLALARQARSAAAAAGAALLDRHSDPHHNRTVLTLVGHEAPRRVARTAVGLLDLRHHAGARYQPTNQQT